MGAADPMALLVDGDNVPPEMLGSLLEHLQRRAVVTERCIFRNWRSTRDSKGWDEVAKRLAFERIDRYKTTEGKNGSDIAVAVAAMDFLHAGVRNFCIASGDTDFAPLVERLRRGGAWVSIVGHKTDGGLLREIADEYQDWKSLMAKPGQPNRQGPESAAVASPPRKTRSSPKTSEPTKAPKMDAAPTAARKSGRPTRTQPTSNAPHAGEARGTANSRPARSPPPVKPQVATRGGRPPPRVAPATPAANPANAAPGSESLRMLLTDCYEVARTDGQVDKDGWVAVDLLGQIARSLDPGFAPSKYGLGSRTSFSRAFERFPQLFAIEAVGRQGNRQYRVRLK